MKQVDSPKRPKSDVNRREFLRRAIGSTVIPSSVVGLVAACTDLEDPTGVSPQLARGGGRGRDAGGYGPVDQDMGELMLPRGFQLRSFGRVGSEMSDGNITPIAHDGMGAFPGPGGSTILVRNHEDRNGGNVGSALGANPYDPVAGGGTTTLVVGANRELQSDFVSLSGTTVNCAGGPTPWGSWLSCEETAVGPDDNDGGSTNFTKTHGWVFEVDSRATGPVDPRPIIDMGRFSHEAVAVDPLTNIIYQTEDNDYDPGRGEPGSGFYRFLPNSAPDLLAGGRLQMMKVKGAPQAILIGRGPSAPDTLDVGVGDTFEVEWVDIPDPTLGHVSFDVESSGIADANLRKGAVFLQGWEQGAVAFDRLEGCWFGQGSVFFHDTAAGRAGEGRVWQYTPAPAEGQGGPDDCGTLRLIFESPSASVLEGPDNITVSPRGGILICEDGSANLRDDFQWLRGLTPAGQIFDFAKNILNDTEFAGACYGPRGQTLFVNIQGSTRGSIADAKDGVTLAIWGPWEAGAL